MGPPRGSWASGESGSTSRLNVDEVNNLCDLVAERECDVTHRHTRFRHLSQSIAIVVSISIEYKI